MSRGVRSWLTVALCVAGLPACTLSARADVNQVRQTFFLWCGERMSANECPRWEQGVAGVVDAALRHPDDAYAQGQAVYALTRAGALSEARRVVEACEAEGWWCMMLRGHVLAESGELTAAEEAFDAMVLHMPEAVRCDWTDLSWVVPPSVWSELSADDCMAEAVRSETVWWLSDPSHLMPGNDAKVVHYNRVALATLHDDQLLSFRGRVVDGRGHHLEHHREMLRQGMSTVEYSERWREGSGRRYSLIPDAEALLDPLHSTPGSWDLEPAPGDVHTEVDWVELVGLSPQVAFFERGDSLLATAAIDLSQGSLLERGRVQEAGMVLTTGPDESAFVASTAEDLGGRYVFSSTVPRSRYLVSVEAIAGLVLGRARFGHALPHPTSAPVRLSDLLVYTSGDTRGVGTLAEALPRMRGGHRWRAEERVGLYLEVYGSDDPEGYGVSVALAPAEGQGILGRIGSVFGFDPPEPVEVTWREEPDRDVAVIGLTLSLANVDPGEYRIEVVVDGMVSGPVSVSRTIEVVDEGG